MSKKKFGLLCLINFLAGIFELFWTLVEIILCSKGFFHSERLSDKIIVMLIIVISFILLQILNYRKIEAEQSLKSKVNKCIGCMISFFLPVMIFFIIYYIMILL